MRQPRVNSEGQKDLARAQESFDDLSEGITSINPLDCKAPEPEINPFTKLSKREMDLADAPYIVPQKSMPRTVGGKDNAKVYFNEKHRSIYERESKYIKVTVENYECIGSPVEMWTAEFGCDPAYFWVIPTNTPVYVPRYVARRLKKCQYHEMHMPHDDFSPSRYIGTPNNGAMGAGVSGTQFYGRPNVIRTRQRLDANLYTNELSSSL